MRNPIFILTGVLALAACAPSSDDVNLIANGDFGDGMRCWSTGENAYIHENVCRMELKIPRYHSSWNEMCRQTVEVEPGTEYVLTAEARMSLYPLSYGAYLGVRTDDGAVLKDRLFLLARDNMTPMHIEFNSGDNTRLTVFCGAWCDCNAIFEADNFSLRKKH